MRNKRRLWHKKSDFLKSLYRTYEDKDIESLLTLRDGLSVIIRSKHTGNYDFDSYKGYVIYD